MVFPIQEPGLKIHTPKSQLLQRPSVRATQATTASRRLVDQESGESEHEQNISDQTWLSRQLLPEKDQKESQEENPEEEQPSAATGKRALKSYAAVEHSRKPVVPHLPASHIMSSPVVTLAASATINEGWKRCQQEGIHYLVLLDETGSVEGVISDRELLAEAAGVGPLSAEDIDLTEVPLQQLVQAPLLTAQEDTDIRDIARLMLKNKIRAVPVLDDHQQLVGLVTRSNLMLGLANQSIQINT